MVFLSYYPFPLFPCHHYEDMIQIPSIERLAANRINKPAKTMAQNNPEGCVFVWEGCYAEAPHENCNKDTLISRPNA
jgi:hypothetical protein